MIRCLNQTFDRYTSMKVNDIHLKKKNDFINDLKSFMRLNRNTYDVHFKKNARTSRDPYYKIDSLIWSTVYFEKIDRYDADNYSMAEYLIENYNQLKDATFDQFETMTFTQFSPFFQKPSPSPHAEILAKNPPLSREEFNAELDSANPVKKFFYTYQQSEEEQLEYEERIKQLPLHAESKQSQSVIGRHVDTIKFKIGQTQQKFQTLDTFDYFEEQEEASLEKEKKEQKYLFANKKRNSDLSLLLKDGKIDELRKKIRLSSQSISASSN